MTARKLVGSVLTLVHLIVMLSYVSGRLSPTVITRKGYSETHRRTDKSVIGGRANRNSESGGDDGEDKDE